MAMGVPVIATPVTAVPELVVDGESGLLVPPNDAFALANAIERMRANPGLRTRLAENARARVSERFDVGRNIRAYAQLFTGS
jgi:glycosyltransferase involved in cell wall biosynthesis